MKAYHEYLELYVYFARGVRRLTSAEFAVLDGEFKALAARHPVLDKHELGRLDELKELLHRDRP